MPVNAVAIYINSEWSTITLFISRIEQRILRIPLLEQFTPEYLKNVLWTQFTGNASVAQPGRAAAS
jgi:hypothetical protein